MEWLLVAPLVVIYAIIWIGTLLFGDGEDTLDS